MRNNLFHAVKKGQSIGNGTVGEMSAFLEAFINILFPENGIEWWKANDTAGYFCLAAGDPMPKAGSETECVHHVACYARSGSCEGDIVEIGLSLRSGAYARLATAKTFGGEDESWAIARAVGLALNSVIFYWEIPELVELAANLPKAQRWHRQSSLAEPVVLSHSDTLVSVVTSSGKILSTHDLAQFGTDARFYAKAYVSDWSTILKNMGVEFSVLETPFQIPPDLAGYTISKRGGDVAGFYVLPPGGNASDDRDYLGYFNDLPLAVSGASQHRSQMLLQSSSS